MPTTTKTQSPKKNTKAEKLKKQGNERHAKGQYAAAYKKYTEAIEADPSDADLWANRAASSLALQKYMEAIIDASKAIELDPKHHKGYSRLAEAASNLSQWPQSIQAWKKALQLLSEAGSLSAKDQALKRMYEDGLKKADANSKKPGGQVEFVIASSLDDEKLQKYPWARAEKLYQRFSKENKQSSALVMMKAYEAFKLGSEMMSRTVETQLGAGFQVVAVTGVLDQLSNAICWDPRVFHIPRPTFLDEVKKTIEYNTQHTGAWTQMSVRTVKEKAPILVQTKGWGVARRALAITVRCWILKGFIQQTVQRVSTDLYRNALDVIEWGRKTWPNVSKIDRGVIFELSFMRGIQRLYLSSLIDAYESRRSTTRKESIEDIAKLAQQIVISADLDDFISTEPVTLYECYPPYASFWIYPKAEAYAAIGWCHLQNGSKASGTMEKAKLFREAAEWYLRSANTMPKDDEFHANFLNAAISCLFQLGVPLRLVLPLCGRIRQSLPGIQEIWTDSVFSDKIQERVSRTLAFEADCKQKMEQGKVNLDSIVFPEHIKPLFRRDLPQEFAGPLPRD